MRGVIVDFAVAVLLALITQGLFFLMFWFWKYNLLASTLVFNYKLWIDYIHLVLV